VLGRIHGVRHELRATTAACAGGQWVPPRIRLFVEVHDLLRLFSSVVTTLLQLPAHVRAFWRRSYDGGTRRSRSAPRCSGADPRAQPAAPIPTLRTVRVCQWHALHASPNPSRRIGWHHAEEHRPKETEVQELRRKRHAQEGRQGRSVPKMRRERHQAVTATDEPRSNRALNEATRLSVSVSYAILGMRALIIRNPCTPHIPTPQPHLGHLQISPDSNDEKSLFE
jgi:hypothetical protein